MFRGFRLVYRADRWVRRRFTPAGRIVLAGCVGAMVLGLDTRQTMAYQMAPLAAALLALAMLAATSFRPRVAARRELPRHATVGQALSYPVRLTNTGSRVQHEVQLEEALDEELPSYEEFATAHEPGEERRNWFDRRVGYPRWSWLARRRRGARTERVDTPALPPGSAVSVEMGLLPERRGRLRLRALALSRVDALGLFRGRVELPLPATVLVLPRRYPVRRIELPGHRRYQPGGIALAAAVGDSGEFISLRDYRPGDPPRHIHWRSWARTGRPIVKDYQEEFFVRYALFLDTFATPQQEARFEAAVSVAASLASAVGREDTLLDLMFAGEQAYCFTAGRGLADTARLLEVLAGVRPSPGRNIDRVAALVLGHAARLSGCLCVLLAWDEQRAQFVRELHGAGVPLEVLVITEVEESPVEPPAGLAGHFHALRRDRLAEGLARL